MGWDGKQLDEMGWKEMEWNGMRWKAMGWDAMQCNRVDLVYLHWVATNHIRIVDT